MEYTYTPKGKNAAVPERPDKEDGYGYDSLQIKD